MNGLFVTVIIICGAYIAVKNPDTFFQVMTDGGEKAVLLSAKLIAVYAVSMGVIKVAENAGLLKKLTKLLAPINKRLFKCEDEKVCGYICANMSANLLGMGGVATPMGINAMDGLLRRVNARYTSAVFFVINAAGLQLLPLSVIALRSASGSAAASDIILPSLLSMAVCLLSSVTLVNIFIKRD